LDIILQDKTVVVAPELVLKDQTPLGHAAKIARYLDPPSLI